MRNYCSAELMLCFWAQYPLHAQNGFRDFEKGDVDFLAIYSGKTDERTKFKVFFRTVWVEVAELLVHLRGSFAVEETDAFVRSVTRILAACLFHSCFQIPTNSFTSLLMPVHAIQPHLPFNSVKRFSPCSVVWLCF